MSKNYIRIYTTDLVGGENIRYILSDFDKYYDGSGYHINTSLEFFYYDIPKDILKKMIKILDNCNIKVKYIVQFVIS